MGKYSKYTNEELADAHVFPSELSPEEQRRAEAEFSAYRRKRIAEMSTEEKIFGQVVRLKFLMEDCANSKEYKKELTFGYFLGQYIDALHTDKKVFSDEISIEPAQLEKLLHDKQAPTEKILFRLYLHSNQLIPALTWLRVVEKQKEMGIINDDEKLRKSESKFVKKVDFAFV